MFERDHFCGESSSQRFGRKAWSSRLVKKEKEAGGWWCARGEETKAVVTRSLWVVEDSPMDGAFISPENVEAVNEFAQQEDPSSQDPSPPSSESLLDHNKKSSVLYSSQASDVRLYHLFQFRKEKIKSSSSSSSSSFYFSEKRLATSIGREEE